MTSSNQSGTPVAMPGVEGRPLEQEHWDRSQHEWGELLQAFLDQSLTPTAFHQFEHGLQALLQRCGRRLLESAMNQLEPEPPAAQVCRDREYYRLRPKSPRRNLDSLFGPLRLWRYRYEALTPGEPSWFPLEERLGLEAERATPALAERVAAAAVSQTQAQVLAMLRDEHGVHWSVETLRKVTRSMSNGMAEHREAAEVAQLQSWLQQAEAAGGRHQPVLSVGRDGVMVPVRDESDYREAAVGTVSVIDGHGKRVGTIYLGRMPEKNQKTLSRQMTGLITGLLAVLAGALPRLHYVSDGGYEPTRYFRQVLCKLVDPFRPGRLLQWTWVIDFYHACSYLTKMGEALCGLVAVPSWVRKMRHWLRDKRNGVYRVLHSAAALRSRSQRRWTAAERKAYQDGYRYLKKRRKFMDYATYRARGLPIGSGVTEAACKTVFTQRLKQSGMSWDREGGQVIVELRTLWLSGVWSAVHSAYLAAKPLPELATQQGQPPKTVPKAA